MRKLEVGLALYRLLDPLRQSGADAGHRGEIRNGGLAHAPHASEPTQQRALLGRADPFDVVENALHGAFRADLLVVGDREPMRLVADPLDEIEPLRRPRKHDWVRSRRHGRA